MNLDSPPAITTWLWTEHAGDLHQWHRMACVTTEMDWCKLERVLLFTVIENWVDSHYPGSAANGWIGLWGEVARDSWKMPLSLPRSCLPFIRLLKVENAHSSDLWGLIYQPTPPRRNNKIKITPAIKHCSALCSVDFVSRQSLETGPLFVAPAIPGGDCIFTSF